ncbi:TPA: GTPase family protein, partial [Salmonella enterica]
VNKKARDDFGETVGSVLDTISSMPLIPPPIRAIIQAARDTVVSVARAVWNFFF